MKVDMQDPGAIDKLQKHLEEHVKGLVSKAVDKKKPSSSNPDDDDDSDFVSDNGSEDEPEFLIQMKAFFGDTHEEQDAYLMRTFFEGTESVLTITDPTK